MPLLQAANDMWWQLLLFRGWDESATATAAEIFYVSSIMMYFCTSARPHISGEIDGVEPNWTRTSSIHYHSYCAPDRRAEYCDDRVCLSVCTRSYLRNYRPYLHRIFYACYPWSWLGPPLATWRYVRYFRFYGWRHTGRYILNLKRCSRRVHGVLRWACLSVCLFAYLRNHVSKLQDRAPCKSGRTDRDAARGRLTCMDPRNRHVL